MKPPWSKQFSLGSQRLWIGNVRDGYGRTLPAVHLPGNSYYLDDASACDLTEFLSEGVPTLEPREVRIDVCSVEERCRCQCDQTANGGNVPWILDVCLDYFSTSNPYLTDLRSYFGAVPLSDSEASDVDYWLSLVIIIFQNPGWRSFAADQPCQCKCCSDILTSSSFRDRRRVRAEFIEVINSVLLFNDDFSSSTKKPRLMLRASDNDRRLQDYYCIRWNNELADFLALVPRLPQTVREFIATNNFQFLLPHYIATVDETIDLMKQMKACLLDCCSKFGLPKIITIARSKMDGYTPVDSVDRLQAGVMQIIEEIVGTNVVIHDLTENAAELCRTLFLSECAKSYIARTVLSDDA